VANDLWQIDGTRLKLADGEPAWVVDCLDDHARFLLAAIACASPTGEAAWACFLAASSAYGLPRQLLSDNHSSFTGRLYGFEVSFERRLAEVGVELINAAPAHPQTLGKLERFHRTLKEWLEDEGPAADLEHLQLLLDRFRTHYNQERPHQGIGNLTPVERYLPAPRAGTASRRAPTRRSGERARVPAALAPAQGVAQRRRQLRRPRDHARQALRQRRRAHRRGRRAHPRVPRRRAHPRTRPRPHEAVPEAR
jgi:Integrase core domain